MSSSKKISPDTNIDRRRLLGKATLIGAGLGLAACGEPVNKAPAIGRKRKQLSMVTTWPKNLPGLGTAAERVASRITELSDGQMEVKLFAAGELVPALQSFDAVAGGAADMYHGAEYYWQSKSSGFNFFAAAPMGMTATEITGWVNFGGGQQLWDELSGQFGVIAFQAGNTGHQMGGWFRKEINGLEDFRGLKMRIPGLGGKIIRELGGSSETLPGGEIFQALQTGIIDATEWVGPWNDLALGFHRAAPFYYGPGFHEPGTVLSLGINRKRWDAMDSYEQTIIKTACAEANNLSLGEFPWFNAQSLKVLKSEHGVQLRSFPSSVTDRIVELAKDIRAEAGNSGGLEKRIHASFESALASFVGWGNISDGLYHSVRMKNKL